MSYDAADAYQRACEDLAGLWNDYHVWYGFVTDPDKLYRHRPDVFKRRCKLLSGSNKEIKVLFYKELKKKSAMKRLQRSKALDEVRFNTFADLFYANTGVCAEFARRKLYKMLR
jgi:hypothetical protein